MSVETMNSTELLQQFQISKDDLLLIRQFGQHETANVSLLIDDFYIWLENQTWYSQYFSKGVPSNVQTLQRNYWQGFLKAHVDDDYVQQRVTVGNVHARINLPVTAYLAGMNFAQNWLVDVAQQAVEDKQQCYSLLNSINKLIQLDCNIVMHVYSMQSMDTIRKQGELTSRIVKETTRVIGLAAEGDFKTVYKSQDASDALEAPINQMIRNLEQYSEETKKDQWLKSGIAELSLKLRGGLTIPQLSDKAIEFIANYLGAQVGVFYVTNDSGVSVLSASYAFTHRKHLSTSIKSGEGLVGQAMKEQKVIVLSCIPEDYITINSGLGELRPNSIVVQPLIHESQVKGVIELGSFGCFSQDQLDFLDQVSESIAVSINTAQDQEKMHLLLTEAQQTSNELQRQQEELETVNQTLEEQAQALKQSEEELTVQRDMLEESNEELKRKTIDLQEQSEKVELARQEIQKKADQLAAASKYKSEFLANMSHELRTPLNSLLLLSQALINNKERNLNDEQIEDLRVIYGGGRTLLNLINDILDLSKVEAGKMTVSPALTNIAALMASLESEFIAIAKERQLSFEVEVGDLAGFNIFTDSQRLEQILRNLLSNAFKFTNHGGVTFSVGRTSADENPIGTSAITFSVEDTGIGIESEFQASIFEAFQQADGSTVRAYSGTGLGLTISKELAKLLGGDIGLESSKDKGSHFKCHIPIRGDRRDIVETSFSTLHRLEHATTDYQLNDSEGNSKNIKKILIIEDDPDIVQAISSQVKRHGFHPMVTNSGLEALQIIAQLTPTAVVLGFHIKDIDQQEVRDSLKKIPQMKSVSLFSVATGKQSFSELINGKVHLLTSPASCEDLEALMLSFRGIAEKSPKSVLLIGSSEFSKSDIKQTLSQKGIELKFQKNPETSISAIAQNEIDCCLVDLSFENTSGFDFLNYLHCSDLSDIPPIIIFSGDQVTETDLYDFLAQAYATQFEEQLPTSFSSEELDAFLAELSIKDSVAGLKQSLDSYKTSLEKLENRKVLVVDDDYRNVYAVSKVLKDHGIQVLLADNGELAVEKLKQEKDIDLVLMDIMMPVMDGYDAMRKIRATVSDSIPMIALTAKAMVTDREKCIEAGANDYMAKPIEAEKLLAMIGLWCDQ